MKKIYLILPVLIILLLGNRARAAVSYTSRGLRDPFKSPFEMQGIPVVAEAEPTAPTVEYGLSHLNVQGMVWGSKMPQAIINNQIVRIGEIIDGAEILEIRREGVYVLYEGKQYIVRPTIYK